jgi:hypothetical protein
VETGRSHGAGAVGWGDALTVFPALGRELASAKPIFPGVIGRILHIHGEKLAGFTLNEGGAFYG